MERLIIYYKEDIFDDEINTYIRSVKGNETSSNYLSGRNDTSLNELFSLLVGNMFKSFCDNSFRRKIDNDNYYYEYAIYFEERKFIVIYKGMKYYLDLDKETIDNYEKGEYNAITLKLKKLLDEFALAIKREEESKRKKKIISDGQNGIFLDDESKKIYIEYLQNIYNQEKKEYLDCVFEEYLRPFIAMGMLLTIALFLDSVVVSRILVVLDFIFFTITSVCFIKYRSTLNLKRYVAEINKLNLELNGNTKELPYKQTDVISISKGEKPVSAILQELSNAVLKIKYLNDEDKKVCGDMAVAILDEYTKRSIEINLVNSSKEIVLDLDGELSLKSDMVSKIKKLEDEIDKRKDVSKKNQRINTDYEIVLSQINDCCSVGDRVIDGGHLTRARIL